MVDSAQSTVLTSYSATDPLRRARPVRVFVVTDVALYCEGLSRSLSERDRIEVLGASTASDEAVQHIGASRADVVLVDSPTVRHTDIVARIIAASPTTTVIAFAVNEDPAEVLECARAGVAGYVPRSASIDDLIQMIEGVERGELQCSPRVAAAMFRQLAALGAHGAPSYSTLTLREREIVTLVGQGLSNKEIAGELGIELPTVKSHVHHILEKLGVSRRAAVAAKLRLEHRGTPGPRTTPHVRARPGM